MALIQVSDGSSFVGFVATIKLQNALCVGADFCCRNPQKSQLLQHEKGRRHAASGSGTPSWETFLKMLDERQNHVSLRKAFAGRSKTLKMMWCTKPSRTQASHPQRGDR